MFKVKNPKYKERVLEKLEGQHFMRHIGFELTQIEAGKTEGWMPFRKHLEQQDAFVHGGAIATAADIVAGFAAYTLVAENEYVVTAEIKVSYFRPAVCEKLMAKGYVIKPGNHFHFCESEVWAYSEEKEFMVAKATTTMAVITKK